MMSEERQGHVNYTPNLHFLSYLSYLSSLLYHTNMPPKKMTHVTMTAATAPTKVLDPGAAPLGSNHKKSKVSKVVSDSHLEEPEGSPINLGLEMNPSIDHVQVVGQRTAEYTTQDTFNVFISNDYAYKEEMQSTVNGLSLEL